MARFTVTICGLGRDAETPAAVRALLLADDGWTEEGEYAEVRDNATGVVETIVGELTEGTVG